MSYLRSLGFKQKKAAAEREALVRGRLEENWHALQSSRKYARNEVHKVILSPLDEDQLWPETRKWLRNTRARIKAGGAIDERRIRRRLFRISRAMKMVRVGERRSREEWKANKKPQGPGWSHAEKGTEFPGWLKGEGAIMPTRPPIHTKDD